MAKLHFKWGIRDKFLVYVIMLLIVLGSILTVVSVIQQKNILDKELKKRGMSLVKSLASSSILSVLLDDKKSLNSLVQTLKNEEDVSYVVIVSTFNGKVLAESGQTVYGSSEEHKVDLNVQEPVFRSYVTNAMETFYIFTAPVNVEEARSEEEPDILSMGDNNFENGKSKLRKIAVVEMRLSLANVYRQIDRIKQTAILLTFLVIIFGSSVVIFFSAGNRKADSTISIRDAKSR